MLLPVLSNVKDRAGQMRCVSRLRQCYLTMQMYGNDWRMYPPLCHFNQPYPGIILAADPAICSVRATWPWPQVADLLAPYLRGGWNSKIIRCTGKRGGRQVSWAWEQFDVYAYYREFPMSDWDAEVRRGCKWYYEVNRNVTRAQERWLVSDGAIYNVGAGYSWDPFSPGRAHEFYIYMIMHDRRWSPQFYFPHMRGKAYTDLFVDGHVAIGTIEPYHGHIVYGYTIP